VGQDGGVVDADKVGVGIGYFFDYGVVPEVLRRGIAGEDEQGDGVVGEG